MENYFRLKRRIGRGLFAVVALATASGISGCAIDPYGRTYVHPQMAGNLGAIAGMLILGSGPDRGSRVAGSIAGLFIGHAVGTSIALHMNSWDKTLARATTYRALEHGAPGSVYNWSNPHSGVYGHVRPHGQAMVNRQQNCRSYAQTIYIGGRPETATGVACRQPDGNWQIIS